MLDDALGVPDRHAGPSLGRVAGPLTDVLPGVRRDVPQSHRVFEHLPGVAEARVSNRSAGFTGRSCGAICFVA
jgi:hypothetical protein